MLLANVFNDGKEESSVIKNLMGKLHSKDATPETTENGQALAVPPVPRPQNVQPDTPTVHDNIQSQAASLSVAHQQGQARESKGGKTMIRDNDEGIIIDLGEGISLNIPIQKRMSLGDFLKVAEKVKALEMLSEDNEYKKNY
jgi:hypothetical protein